METSGCRWSCRCRVQNLYGSLGPLESAHAGMVEQFQLADCLNILEESFFFLKAFWITRKNAETLSGGGDVKGVNS